MAPLGSSLTVVAKESRSKRSAKSAPRPDPSYLSNFNHVGGRQSERHATRGSFTPGVRIMSGGVRRDVPLETKINPGKVLFVSDKLKPDTSGEARINTARTTERLGSRGRFSPGIKIFVGGAPRSNFTAKSKTDPGQVLFESRTLEPDRSGEARTNAVRPSERLGSRGGFTRGVRLWMGGVPRDIPIKVKTRPGKVLFVSSERTTDHSWESRTNVVGGRDGERLGRVGSFEHGVVEAAGGPLHMPSPGSLELWREPGQTENKFRRCGPSHFVAGVSILSGGMPMYTRIEG